MTDEKDNSNVREPDVLDRFWEFLEEQDPKDRIHLYNVLTAYRGPDGLLQATSTLKKETTALIRALAGAPTIPNGLATLYGGDNDGAWNGETVLAEYETALPWVRYEFLDDLYEKHEVSWHFRSHAFEAFLSLVALGRATWKPSEDEP